jgi:hypothetical protein
MLLGSHKSSGFPGRNLGLVSSGSLRAAKSARPRRPSSGRTNRRFGGSPASKDQRRRRIGASPVPPQSDTSGDGPAVKGNLFTSCTCWFASPALGAIARRTKTILSSAGWLTRQSRQARKFWPNPPAGSVNQPRTGTAMYIRETSPGIRASHSRPQGKDATRLRDYTQTHTVANRLVRSSLP